MVPWFERPVIFDVRARPSVVQSQSGSRDLQMVRGGVCAGTRWSEEGVVQRRQGRGGVEAGRGSRWPRRQSFMSLPSIHVHSCRLPPRLVSHHHPGVCAACPALPLRSTSDCVC
jgi:hypothetical protein